MLGRLLSKSLSDLQRAKLDLAKRAQRQATTERRIVERLGRALAGVGYRLEPLTLAPGASPNHGGMRRRSRVLRCPHCDRRFSHPLPMARHITASHKRAAPTKSAPAPRGAATRKRRRRARKTPKKTAR